MTLLKLTNFRDLHDIKKDLFIPQKSNFIVENCIKEAIKVMTLSMKHKNVKIDYLTELEHVEVYSDANRIGLVLKNVLIASLELTRDDSMIEITCWTEIINAKVQLFFAVTSHGL